MAPVRSRSTPSPPEVGRRCARGPEEDLDQVARRDRHFPRRTGSRTTMKPATKKPEKGELVEDGARRTASPRRARSCCCPGHRARPCSRRRRSGLKGVRLAAAESREVGRSSTPNRITAQLPHTHHPMRTGSFIREPTRHGPSKVKQGPRGHITLT